MTLYELTGEQARLEELLEDAIDPETGEIIDEALVAAYDAATLATEEKAEACAIMVKNFTAEAEAIKAEIKTLTTRARTLTNRAEGLRGYMAHCLAPGQTVKTPRAAISWRRSEAVEFDDTLDVRALPPEFTKTTIEPNKTAIKAALKQGDEIPGAYLVERQNLQIK